MTTEAATQVYLAQHLYKREGMKVAIYNPKDLPILDLPIIYGFNNGGSGGFWHAELISADGELLGSHLCSDEGYMEYDLGILEGTRSDRHEGFAKHYPEGYRMSFVGLADVELCEGLQAALKAYEVKNNLNY